MTIINDLICETCGDTGPDVPFPLFPLTGADFGKICVECDEAKFYNNNKEESNA